MAETLATYTAMVQADVDETSVSAKPLIETCVKQTYQEIIRFSARYLVGTDTDDQTAVIGQSAYPISDYQDDIAVLYKQDGASSFIELDRILQEDFIRFYTNASTGTPSKWYYNGQNIELAPAPSDAGTLRIVGVPIVADINGSSVIPSRFNEVVRYGASAKYLASDNNPAAVEYFELYDRAKRSMLLDLSERVSKFKPKFYGA